MDKIFLEQYRKLNAEQKMAVDSIEGPVMVVAGPGTGKTTILTLRIANILRQTDSPASGILALTFTDVGVKAMRSKLRGIIGGRADEVSIHTFHGFASSVIREFGEYFPEIHRATQITQVLSESYIRDILKDKKFSILRPLGDPDLYVSKILSTVSDCKKDVWNPDVVRNFARMEIQRIQNEESYLSTRGATKGQLKAEYLERIKKCEKTLLFADVYETYEHQKRKDNKIDFDDLLFELVKVLQENELLLRLLQEKFLYILVDEHQDTNDSQNMIVSLLANFFESPNVFVVGDEKQAIYRFQGASVENFLTFQNIWKDMKVISLTSNYRSHQRILDATHAMIEKNYADGEHAHLRIHLNAHTKHEARSIDYITTDTTDTADEVFISQLQDILKNNPHSTTAVVVRRNRDVEHALSLCQKHNIHASAERGVDIFAHPIGRQYFNILEYLIDPTKTDVFIETCVSGLWGVTFEKSIELIQKVRSKVSFDVSDEISALKVLRTERAHMGPIEYMIAVANLSGLIDQISHDPVSVEVWRGISALAVDIAHRSNLTDPRVLMMEMLAYRVSAQTKSIKIGLGIQDAPVHIMTAHSSKGLEYDFVVLPDATEESWMRRSVSSSFVLPREKDTGDDVRDARRLFYVALTRARQHGVLISPSRDMMGKELLPLRFIGELDQAHIEQKNILSQNKKHEPETLDHFVSRVEEGRVQMIGEYAKRRLVEKGLSVTALNHFCTCPSEFLYKSVLRLPEAPSGTSERGIAMHSALSRVWKSEKRDTTSIQKTIDMVIREYFENSLLPHFEKETIVAELTKNSSFVSKELTEYFTQSGRVLTETWVDTEYSSKHSAPSHIILHGQLDAVIETDESVSVYDYKTREAMSVNAIKGNTKDSDGNYFRQLVFYKILLEGNVRYRDKSVQTALVFVKPDSKGRCPTITLPVTEEDIIRVTEEIETLIHSVWSGEFLTATCVDPDCEWCPRKKYLLAQK